MCVCGGGEGGRVNKKDPQNILLYYYFENYFDSTFLNFRYFEPLFNFWSNGKNCGVIKNNLTSKVRAEFKSISSKQDALSQFYVKQE